jgi:hypothetical protein
MRHARAEDLAALSRRSPRERGAARNDDCVRGFSAACSLSSQMRHNHRSRVPSVGYQSSPKPLPSSSYKCTVNFGLKCLSMNRPISSMSRSDFSGRGLVRDNQDCAVSRSRLSSCPQSFVPSSGFWRVSLRLLVIPDDLTNYRRAIRKLANCALKPISRRASPHARHSLAHASLRRVWTPGAGMSWALLHFL